MVCPIMTNFLILYGLRMSHIAVVSSPEVSLVLCVYDNSRVSFLSWCHLDIENAMKTFTLKVQHICYYLSF